MIQGSTCNICRVVKKVQNKTTCSNRMKLRISIHDTKLRNEIDDLSVKIKGYICNICSVASITQDKNYCKTQNKM